MSPGALHSASPTKKNSHCDAVRLICMSAQYCFLTSSVFISEVYVSKTNIFSQSPAGNKTFDMSAGQMGGRVLGPGYN